MSNMSYFKLVVLCLHVSDQHNGRANLFPDNITKQKCSNVSSEFVLKRMQRKDIIFQIEHIVINNNEKN